MKAEVFETAEFQLALIKKLFYKVKKKNIFGGGVGGGGERSEEIIEHLRIKYFLDCLL